MLGVDLHKKVDGRHFDLEIIFTLSPLDLFIIQNPIEMLHSLLNNAISSTLINIQNVVFLTLGKIFKNMIYLLEMRKERQRYRHKEKRDGDLPTVCSFPKCSGNGLEPQNESRYPFWVAVTQIHEPQSLPANMHITNMLDLGAQLGLAHRHFFLDAGI